MQKLKYLLTILLVQSVAVIGFSQADAGPDQTICDDEPVIIGTLGSGAACYSWSPEEGLDDPKSPTPKAFPETTTTYTLTVTGSDFSFRDQDEVTVDVVMGELTFSPETLSPDGMSESQALLSPIPSGSTISWSIVSDPLGCTIDEATGFITAGTDLGSITVRGTVDPGGCFKEGQIDIINTVEDVMAEDAQHPGRIAMTDDTLYLLGHQDARLTAIPVGGSFPPGFPLWEYPFQPDGTVSFVDSDPENDYYIAEGKKVFVERKQKTVNTLSADAFFDGSATVTNLRDKLNFKSQTGASYTVSFNPNNTEYTIETVERYMNPDLGTKHQFTLGVKAEVAGRITHPAFSGHFKLFSQEALWELYAQAGITVNGGGGVAKDESVAYPAQIQGSNLTLTATGTIQAGYYIYVNTSFVQLEGDLNAATGIFGSVQLAGPQLQSKFGWNGLVGNVYLKAYFSDPNDPFVDYSGSKTLIDGNETEWKTFMDFSTL